MKEEEELPEVIIAEITEHIKSVCEDLGMQEKAFYDISDRDELEKLLYSLKKNNRYLSRPQEEQNKMAFSFCVYLEFFERTLQELPPPSKN